MLDKSKILAIIEPLAANTDIFIIGLTVTPANDIELTIDANRRLTLDDCASLSKQIQAELDLIEPDFSLTVFSAGIGLPLADYRQFAKIIGKPVEIILRSGAKQSAKLESANINQDFSGEITISYQIKETVDGKKRKELVDKAETINMIDIKSICELLEIK